jgi:hypothetical protein
LKLTGTAKMFYQGCQELHAQDASWQTFKDVFRQRFRDVDTDQHHYVRLQTAHHEKNEKPLEFLDWCRALAQKITCKMDNPVVQWVHQQNAERMLLASYITGLRGSAGTQVRYRNPQTVEEAVEIPLAL